MKSRPKMLVLATVALILLLAFGVVIWICTALRQPRLRPGMQSAEVVTVLRTEESNARQYAERSLPPFRWVNVTPSGERQVEVITGHYFRKGHEFLLRYTTLGFTNGTLESISSQWKWEWNF